VFSFRITLDYPELRLLRLKSRVIPAIPRLKKKGLASGLPWITQD